MTLASIVRSLARLHVVRIVAAVAVFEVMTNTALLAANTRLKQYPALLLRKRHHVSIGNINKNFVIEDLHAVDFLNETMDLYGTEVDDDGPSSSDDDMIAVLAATAHTISEVKLENIDVNSNESPSNGGGGDTNNSGNDSSNVARIAAALDTVSEVLANAKLERLYQIRKRYHVIDTDENNNNDDTDGGNTTVVKDIDKDGHVSDSRDGSHHDHSITGKSALLEYKVLPNHNIGRRQISFAELMGNNETANMIHEFDTDLEMKAFVESDNRFPYDFVRLKQSGTYRLISGIDAKENARRIFAMRRFVAGHCTLVKSGESVIMAGEVVRDANTGRIIVYGKSGHYRPSSLVGLRQVGRHFRSYFSNEHQ
jgi:hypothetical protein